MFSSQEDEIDFKTNLLLHLYNFGFQNAQKHFGQCI